jgi:hypothetical protein
MSFVTSRPWRAAAAAAAAAACRLESAAREGASTQIFEKTLFEANYERSRAGSVTLTGNERRFVEHRNAIAPNRSPLRLVVDCCGWLFPSLEQGNEQ